MQNSSSVQSCLNIFNPNIFVKDPKTKKNIWLKIVFNSSLKIFQIFHVFTEAYDTCGTCQSLKLWPGQMSHPVQYRWFLWAFAPLAMTGCLLFITKTFAKKQTFLHYPCINVSIHRVEKGLSFPICIWYCVWWWCCLVWSGSTPMRHNSIKRLAGAGAAGIYLTFITLIRQMVRRMEIYNIFHKKDILITNYPFQLLLTVSPGNFRVANTSSMQPTASHPITDVTESLIVRTEVTSPIVTTDKNTTEIMNVNLWLGMRIPRAFGSHGRMSVMDTLTVEIAVTRKIQVVINQKYLAR